jgi:hypothetical protein
MIDPTTVQILFADLQPGIAVRSKTNPPQALAASAGVLAEVADLLKLPIHFSVVPEGGKAPNLSPSWPDTAVRRHRICACPQIRFWM